MLTELRCNKCHLLLKYERAGDKRTYDKKNYLCPLPPNPGMPGIPF